MLADDRHFLSGALRGQAVEPQEGDHHREDAAPTVEVVCPQRLLYLPPSPPYSDPRLKLPIYLPSLDDHAFVAYTAYVPSGCDMGMPGNTVQYVVNSGGPGPSLLSPPYSPRRRLMNLADVEEEEDLLSPSTQSEPSTTSDDREWQSFDESDALEPHCLRFNDLDLGEESDCDRDEPPFLKATRAKELSDGLDLNLFGTVPSCSSSSQLCPPDSPRAPSSALPPIEDLEFGKPEEPLFKSSDFDVFKNGWDEISQNAEGARSDNCTVFDDNFERGEHSGKCLSTSSPESPSRRSSVGLPDVGAALEATGLIYSTGSLFLDRSAIEHSLQTPPRHQPIDIPSEVFQSPYNFPLILSSPPPRSPPLYSLLFAPPEPRDIPLTNLPETRLQDLFNGDLLVHSYLLEESRLRVMQQEMTAIEAQARSKEAMLTEYIARLNAAKPPSISSLSGDLSDDGASRAIGDRTDHHQNDQPEGSESGISLISPQGSVAGEPNPATSITDFYLARRREVQNAVAMRAAERRSRKQAKERARELEALLQLKSGQIRDVSRWTRSSRQKGSGADEPVVLAASGSDRHPDHTNGTICDDSSEQLSEDRHDDEVRQLVAKMIFRRRDSSRPLSGKFSQPSRPYVFSSLSQEVLPHFDDYDDVLRVEKELFS